MAKANGTDAEELVQALEALAEVVNRVANSLSPVEREALIDATQRAFAAAEPFAEAESEPIAIGGAGSPERVSGEGAPLGYGDPRGRHDKKAVPRGWEKIGGRIYEVPRQR